MLQVKFYHSNWNHKLKCWRIDFLQFLKKSFRIAVGILTCQKCHCRKLALTFYKSTWRPVFVFPFNHQSCLYELNTSDKTRLSLWYFECVIRNTFSIHISPKNNEDVWIHETWNIILRFITCYECQVSSTVWIKQKYTKTIQTVFSLE